MRLNHLNEEVPDPMLFRFGEGIGAICGMVGKCLNNSGPIYTDQIRIIAANKGVTEPKTCRDCLVVAEETCRFLLNEIEKYKAVQNN